MTVPTGSRRSRYTRVTLFHGDDKPLKLTSVLAEAVARNIVFPSPSSGDYWLYFGNPDARQPSYDIAMVLGKTTLDHAVTVSAEGREANPAYKAPGAAREAVIGTLSRAALRRPRHCGRRTRVFHAALLEECQGFKRQRLTCYADFQCPIKFSLLRATRVKVTKRSTPCIDSKKQATRQSSPRHRNAVSIS